MPLDFYLYYLYYYTYDNWRSMQSAAHQVIYIYYNRTTFMSRRINIYVLCMIFKLRLSFLYNNVAPKAIFDAQYFTH